MTRHRTLPMSALAGLALTVLACSSCATELRRFALREPVWRDTDMEAVSTKCHTEEKPEDPRHVACTPKIKPSPLIWDGADNIFFRPLSEAVGISVSGESANVNSMDEVPDSSWFTNRIGLHPMSMREIELGPCSPEMILDGSAAADGTWVIDKGKMGGQTDGFRVLIPGHGKYLFKADDADTPEHSSGAAVLGSRVFHAAGYYTDCEQIVYFRPSALKLMPGLKWKHNFGDTQAFGPAELEKVLAHSPKKGDLVRMAASAWLPGVDLGGFEFQDTRGDDPNDVVPHGDRRDLRGKRLLDAWIGRVDERRGNTIDAWLADRPGPPDSSPGRIVHYQIDTSEALGSVWQWEPISERLGYEYIVDWGQSGADFVTLGVHLRPWDTVAKRPGKELFGYYNVEDFVPDAWKAQYPLQPFSRMTEGDGAWMARILAHFTPEIVTLLARTAEFTQPGNTEYINEVLQGRLQKILERYLTRLSPVTELRVEGPDTLCGVDLAEWRGLRDPAAFHYSARILHGTWQVVTRRPEGGVCVTLQHVAQDGGVPDEDSTRYVRVRIEDGVARGPLVAHLYDLGPSRGYRLAGVERLEK